MTTGEIVGIAVGVAGLGLGAYVLISQRRGGDRTQAVVPPPVPQVRASPPPQTSQTANDINAVIGGVTQGLGAAVQIFDQLSQIFG